VALNLLDYAQVNTNTVIIKFGRTIKISSLNNDNFVVQTSDATPEIVANPFLPINTIVDYNQISRTLTLYWNQILEPNKEYIIRVINFLDAANELISEEQIVFIKGDEATPSSFSSIRVPDIQQVYIEDYSIKTNAYTSFQIIAKNPNFFIKSVDPQSGDFYLENSHNNGRVIISFNSRPATNFLSNTYFKAQRKKIQRTPSRWENITTNVSMHSWKPEVYVDFPSLDSTPSFYVEGADYFESGYKYRIIVSKEVGI
jgi:hypothetical protein